MLDNTVCDFSDVLVKDAIALGIYLQPISGTPLAELVKCSTNGPLSELEGREQNVVFESLTEQSDNSMHNGWTNEIAERAAALMNKRVDIIRSTVIPAIRSISEEIQEKVNTLAGVEFNFNIARYSICDAVNVPSFKAEVDRNATLEYANPSLYPTLGKKSISDIIDLLKSGSASVDDAIMVAATKVGDDNLNLLWESLFLDRSMMTVSNYRVFTSFVLDPTHGLEYAILIFRLSNEKKNKEKDVEQPRSDVAAFRQYREAAAHVIVQKTKEYDNAIKAGSLIRNRVNHLGQIEVYTLIYNDFLKAGGTAEMVIGAANNKNYYNDTPTILQNAKEIDKDYLLIKAASSLEYRLRVKEIVTVVMRNSFFLSLKNELSDFEVDYFEKNQGAMSTIISKFESNVVTLSADSAKDIGRKVCDILCHSRFHYVDCYDFLKTIDAACEDGAVPEDAFAQAVLGEVSKFVVSQIQA